LLDIVEVKPRTEQIERDEARKSLERADMADRLRAVQSCFDGRRVVISSGGEAKNDKTILKEVRGIGQGGAFGSIRCRN
jgi:fructose-bisphosphate aldolase, class I